MSKDINSKVLITLIKALREEKISEQNVKHLRENAEFWLDIIGVAFINASINGIEEDVIDIDYKQHIWRVEDI